MSSEFRIAENMVILVSIISKFLKCYTILTINREILTKFQKSASIHAILQNCALFSEDGAFFKIANSGMV